MMNISDLIIDTLFYFIPVLVLSAILINTLIKAYENSIEANNHTNVDLTWYDVIVGVFLVIVPGLNFLYMLTILGNLEFMKLAVFKKKSKK